MKQADDSEKILNKYWCDKCRKVYDKDMLKSGDNCVKCNADSKYQHMLIDDYITTSVKDCVIVTNKNYMDVLPKHLIYHYNQLATITRPQNSRNMALYSLSKDCIIDIATDKIYKPKSTTSVK